MEQREGNVEEVGRVHEEDWRYRLKAGNCDGYGRKGGLSPLHILSNPVRVGRESV